MGNLLCCEDHRRSESGSRSAGRDVNSTLNSTTGKKKSTGLIAATTAPPPFHQQPYGLDHASTSRVDFHYDDMGRSQVQPPHMLPHISEREVPEEVEPDPSTHPTVRPTFMERSCSAFKIKPSRRSMYLLGGTAAGSASSNLSGSSALRKSNSCSTIYLDDSTISQPHLKQTIKCIALALYFHIVNRTNRGQERLMEIFEERLHPITKDPLPPDYLVRDPDQRSIYRFVRTLFQAAQLTAECAIITLVYVERLLSYAEMELCASNWRRVVLGAVMLASKVWDDQAVWNVDYCHILRDTSLDDMNELERQLLECLEFNINVPASVYAKYYFDLRQLAEANNMQLPLQPLGRERAKKLEASSRIVEDRLLPLKRSYSAERIVKEAGQTPVVLS